MSQAFLREDDIHDHTPPPRNFPVVPPGTKNHLTATGAVRLREELASLTEKRATMTAATRDPDARRQVRDLDHRIQHLQQSLRTAEVAPVEGGSSDVVRFGATVTVRDDHHVETRYRIVGVDETDFGPNHVSWISPLAQALLNARVGQRVRLKTPRGATQLEIVAVGYDSA